MKKEGRSTTKDTKLTNGDYPGYDPTSGYSVVSVVRALAWKG